MTATELMTRMSFDEMQLWVEYDNSNISKADHQFALTMAQFDALKGVKRPDPKRYLPKVKSRRRSRTLEEIKVNFLAAVVNSRGEIHGG